MDKDIDSPLTKCGYAFLNSGLGISFAFGNHSFAACSPVVLLMKPTREVVFKKLSRLE